MSDSHNHLRIAFAGTPPVAATCLERLLSSSHTVVQVYTPPDRPAGRGLKRQASPVKALAMRHGLAVAQPETLKDPQVEEALKALKVDVMVVVAYGMLLPKPILAIPTFGCINVHLSLLPRWRGAAPVERALLAGDSETGVSIMQMDEGLDTGDILLKIPYPIAPTDTASLLYDRLAALGGEGLLRSLMQLGHSSVSPEVQDKTQATYAQKIKKEEALVQWDSPAEHIHRRIRAFNPRPVAFTFVKGTRLRIWEAMVLPHGSVAAPGTVIKVDSHGLYVATGEGTLQITRCQVPGRKAQPVSELLNGCGELFVEGVRFSHQAQRP